MAKSENLNSYLEVKQKTDRDVRQLGVLVSESYEADSTDQQTVINLNFSIDINNKKQIWLFIDGKKLVEGSTSNYTFTNVVSNVSAQITLSSPLIAGLAIQAYKLGAYQESFPNPSSVTATLLNDVAQPHKMAQDAFQNFVKKTFVTAPNTAVINRAMIEDGSLKAIAGVERVTVRGLELLRSEFGGSGGPIYEASNKDSRIRFGGMWSSASNAAGTGVITTTVGDYVEISFYGTGLNILTQLDSNARDNRATIDGGVEGSNVIPTSNSGVLNNRNYSMNTVVNVASGLSSGLHTVRVRCASFALTIYGIEILNQRTDLAVLAGTAYAGMKQEVLPALSTSAFNAGVTGVRGSRVVKYIKDGVISQAVTNVNAASAFLTSTDHTNEEVVRKINFREFGVNRADDFSTLAGVGSARAFTLDDGTTTLTGDNVQVSGSDLVQNVGNFYTLTFVGTGLDIYKTNTGGTGEIIVDGVSRGTLSGTETNYVKICSGLPYGTHTVKFYHNAAGTYVYASDFIIYQPKKPSLPIGAVEVADYNVMADKTIDTTQGAGRVSQGVLRKMNLREIIYTGTWVINATVDSAFGSGWNNGSTTASSYLEFSFFGTGVEHATYISATALNWTYSIDGGNLTGLTKTLVTGVGSLTLADSGVLSGTGSGGVSYNSRICITGLSLGWHKLRVTFNSGQTLYADTFDIHSPIHINTNMKVGSLSLKDSRVFSPIADKPNKIDMSKAKAWCLFDGVNSKILGSLNIDQVLKAATGNYIFYTNKNFKNNYWGCNATSSSHRNLLGTRTANSQTVFFSNSSGIGEDGIVFIACFGELEDEGEF